MGALALLLVVGLVVSLTGLFSSDDDAPAQTGGVEQSSTGAAPPEDAVAGSGPQAEAALARQPMLDVTVDAGLPHALSTRSAGSPIAVPAPQQVTGALVPTGFPATEAGAIGQVLEVTRAGMAGADPQTWARAYSSLAEPGAAPPEQTPMGRNLASFRRSANMADTGPRNGMRLSWAPTSALTKGATADGSYVVACVLGEFVIDYKGRVINAGLGNCLPMRRIGDQWRIASGPAAWAAPATWPGSAEAVAAGYREIQQ
ncbi:hypothetical protein [Pseudonocardia sp. KRD291]|uniref:hypothetical protein n=1 Tax=Pseudonocardia sp. KRD291 TaxID=2792007 RepID=UPI001C4A44B7|nr:hypothetical protein [Pseudonocardia sp. KRD291]MBW0102938.1 hypothetical protein [Pseudonocardia sp. KRD291]